MKFFPPLKLRFFVDVIITAPVKGRNNEVAEVAKKVMEKLKEDVEKKGLQLSVTENGKFFGERVASIQKRRIGEFG